MSLSYASPEQIRQGEALLATLLPECRAELARHSIGARPLSAVAQVQWRYFHERHLRAVCVYEGPKGGWYADLLLRDVPDGVPNAIGTPVQTPHATRDAARIFAGYDGRQAAIESLGSLTTELFGPMPPTHAQFVALDTTQRDRLALLCAAALVFGLYRYPPNDPGAPAPGAPGDRHAEAAARP